MPDSRSLLRDSTLYFLGNVAGRFISFLLIPFYTGHLSTAQYGVMSLVELSTQVVAIVFGLQSVGATMTRLFHDQTEEAARKRVVSTALIGTLAGAAVVVAAAVLGAAPIAVAVGLPGQAGLLRGAFVAMAFGTLAEVVLVYWRMQGRPRLFLAYTAVALLAMIALNIWFIGFRGMGVWGFVASKLIVSGIGCVVLMVLALREVGVAFVPDVAARMARFGWPLVVSGAAFYSIHSSDRVFLARVSQGDVGVYSLAYSFAFLLSVLVGDSFGRAWNVSFYGHASGPGWQARFTRIALWLILITGFSAVGICLFARDTLRLIVPAAYLPPVLMLEVLVFGYFFREVGDFFCNILLIDRGSGQVGRVALAVAALNIGLNWLLITGPLGMGIWGAAWATAITWVVYCGVCWVAAQRLHQVPAPARRLALMLGLCALVVAAHVLLPVGHTYMALVVDAGWMGGFCAMAAVVYLDAGQRRELMLLVRKEALLF